ncbi:MAG: hypothetical protein ACE37H_02845 [Phycisphaeraceae bacterium]
MIRSCLLLLTAALLLTGCNNPTYINVPNDGSDLAINDPNQLTVIKIEKRALQHLLAQSPIPGDVGVRFPAGTTDRVAMSIVAELPDNVFAEGMTPSDEYALVEVREISARGGLARVDVIRPGSLRPREFVEVHLAWDFFDGWVVERTQTRNFQIERLDPGLLVAPGAGQTPPKYEEVKPADETPVEPSTGLTDQPGEPQAAE